MVSTVYQVTCGVRTTLSSVRRGLSAGTGSTAKTSSPAAANRPSRRAATSAGSSTIGPREVLISTASRFIRVRLSASIIADVFSVSGRCRDTTSLAVKQVRQRAPAGGAVVARTGVQHVGAHRGDDRLDPLGDVAVTDQTDCAAADVADRLAEGRIGRPAATLARGEVEGRQPALCGEHQEHRALRDRRGVGAGMLATPMPSRVAACTSMVLTPAPSLCTSRQCAASSRSSADSGRRTCQITSAWGSSRWKVSPSSSAQYLTSSQSAWGEERVHPLAGGEMGEHPHRPVCPSLRDPLGDRIRLLTAGAWGREVVIGVDGTDALVGTRECIVDAFGVGGIDAGVLLGVDHQRGAVDPGQMRFRAGLCEAQAPHAEPAAQRACGGDAVRRPVGLHRDAGIAGVRWSLGGFQRRIHHPRVGPGPHHREGAVRKARGANAFQLVDDPVGDPVVASRLRRAITLDEVGRERRPVARLEDVEVGIGGDGITLVENRSVHPGRQHLGPAGMRSAGDVAVGGGQLAQACRWPHPLLRCDVRVDRLRLIGGHQ